MKKCKENYQRIGKCDGDEFLLSRWDWLSVYVVVVVVKVNRLKMV